MTGAQTSAEVINYFKANWTSTAIAYDNVPNPADASDTSKTWVRLSVNLGKTFEGEKGDDGVGMRTGVIVVQIYTPLTQGTKNGLDLADLVEQLFRRKSINGVFCDEPYTNVASVSDNFYQHNTIVPFWTWVGE
jgi:hypothetical protein